MNLLMLKLLFKVLSGLISIILCHIWCYFSDYFCKDSDLMYTFRSYAATMDLVYSDFLIV